MIYLHEMTVLYGNSCVCYFVKPKLLGLSKQKMEQIRQKEELLQQLIDNYKSCHDHFTQLTEELGQLNSEAASMDASSEQLKQVRWAVSVFFLA